MLVMANFDLVPALRQFVNAELISPRPMIGEILPISIRKRYSGHQTIVIFPQDGYDFFTSREVFRIKTLAELYDCDVIIRARGDVPVIEVSCWFKSVG